jgi:hypothetical protein
MVRKDRIVKTGGSFADEYRVPLVAHQTQTAALLQKAATL